jgi:hypothetical protein
VTAEVFWDVKKRLLPHITSLETPFLNKNLNERVSKSEMFFESLKYYPLGI